MMARPKFLPPAAAQEEVQRTLKAAEAATEAVAVRTKSKLYSSEATLKVTWCHKAWVGTENTTDVNKEARCQSFLAGTFSLSNAFTFPSAPGDWKTVYH